MRVVTKIPNVDTEKENKLKSLGWKKVKEPRSLIISAIISIPFLLLGAIVTFLLIKGISGINLREFGVSDNSVNVTIDLYIVLYYFIFVSLHEVLHLIWVPNFISSKNTYLGFTWFGGFVYTEEEISKNRFLATSITPFLLISIIMPFIFNLFGILTPGLKIVAILNAAASCVDFLNFVIILIQVPRNSTIVLNGNSTYYKE